MVYINDVVTGLIVFPFIAALFTLPYAMVQYHLNLIPFRQIWLYCHDKPISVATLATSRT